MKCRMIGSLLLVLVLIGSMLVGCTGKGSGGEINFDDYLNLSATEVYDKAVMATEVTVSITHRDGNGQTVKTLTRDGDRVQKVGDQTVYYDLKANMLYRYEGNNINLTLDTTTWSELCGDMLGSGSCFFAFFDASYDENGNIKVGALDKIQQDYQLPGTLNVTMKANQTVYTFDITYESTGSTPSYSETVTVEFSDQTVTLPGIVTGQGTVPPQQTGKLTPSKIYGAAEKATDVKITVHTVLEGNDLGTSIYEKDGNKVKDTATDGYVMYYDLSKKLVYTQRTEGWVHEATDYTWGTTLMNTIGGGYGWFLFEQDSDFENEKGNLFNLKPEGINRIREAYNINGDITGSVTRNGSTYVGECTISGDSTYGNIIYTITIEFADQTVTLPDSGDKTPVTMPGGDAPSTQAPVTDAPIEVPVTRPPVQTEPPVVETDPPVVETDPPIIETDPPIIETDPPAVETDPPIVETDPPIVVPGHPDLVRDEAMLMLPAERERLAQLLASYEERTGMPFVAMSVHNWNGMGAQAYTEDVMYSQYGEHGVILIMSVADQEFYVYTAGRAYEAMDEYALDTIIDDVVALFSDSRWYDGYVRYAEWCAHYILGDPAPEGDDLPPDTPPTPSNPDYVGLTPSEILDALYEAEDLIIAVETDSALAYYWKDGTRIQVYSGVNADDGTFAYIDLTTGKSYGTDGTEGIGGYTWVGLLEMMTLVRGQSMFTDSYFDAFDAADQVLTMTGSNDAESVYLYREGVEYTYVATQNGAQTTIYFSFEAVDVVFPF